MTKKKQDAAPAVEKQAEVFYIVADQAGLSLDVRNKIAGRPFAVIDDAHRGWQPTYIGFNTAHRAAQAQLWRTPESKVIIGDECEPVELTVAKHYMADHGAPSAIVLVGYTPEHEASIIMAFAKDIPTIEACGLVVTSSKDSV